MAYDLTPFEAEQGVPDYIRDYYQQGANRDLTEGVGGQFAIMSIRGKVFRVRYNKSEILLTDSQNNPFGFMDVILVKSAAHFSKIFYAEAFNQGDDNPPDCASTDGIQPIPGVPNKQNDYCANCWANVWGSKQTPQGNATKACQDSRRIAILGDGDLENEAFNGPVLLRVPPASLANLATYAQSLDRRGATYFAVVTRIQFDPQSSFPKLTFRPVRWLTQEELTRVLEWQESDHVIQMLGLHGEGEFVQPEATAPAQGQQGASAAPTPAPQPQQPAAAPAARRAPARGRPPAQQAPVQQQPQQAAPAPQPQQPQQAPAQQPQQPPQQQSFGGGFGGAQAQAPQQSGGGFGMGRSAGQAPAMPTQPQQPVTVAQTPQGNGAAQPDRANVLQNLQARLRNFEGNTPGNPQ